MKTCAICGTLGDKVEMDHFPVPKRLGGKETIPLCIVCHHLKDRVALYRWPMPLTRRAAAALVPHLPLVVDDPEEAMTSLVSTFTILPSDLAWEGRLCFYKMLDTAMDWFAENDPDLLADLTDIYWGERVLLVPETA